MKRLFCLLIFNFIFLTSINAQGIVYSRQEADSIYGAVLNYNEVQSILLQKFFNSSDGELMFRMQDGSLIILNSSREQLYPGGITVSPSDVFRVFSVELINQIITDGNSPVTRVELRANEIISLTNGEYTLEYGGECPPYCP
jgi:hypothetical protein